MKEPFTLNHIKTRFIIVILTLIPVAIMSYTLLFRDIQKERETEITKNIQIADLAAHYLNDYIYGFKTALQNFAATSAIINEDGKAIKQIMQDMDLARPEPSLFWVANSSGKLVAKYPDELMDQNIFDREFFKEAMKGKPFTGGPYIGRVTGIEIIVVAVPYFRENQVAGVVGVSIPLSELQSKLASIQVGHSGYATLITLEGKVLSHPRLEEFRKTYSFQDSPLFKALYVDRLDRGYFDLASDEPEHNMHAFVKLKEAPWVVVTIQPLLDLNLKLSQTLSRNVTVLVLVALLIALLIHYILLLRDMKNAEKIKQAEKLAIVGELAAGVAHEIRNPLTAIKGFVQLIDLKKGPHIPPLYIRTILEELDRIEQIVGEMVVLAKPALEAKSSIDIQTLLSNIINLMSHQASMKNIKISLEVEPDLPLISAVKNQLKQVFINLIKNSIEAISGGEGEIRIKAVHQSDDIVISVTDNGIGIPQETIKKLGTPFFSTKETGTGLGLMISYGIIQNHKGEISVESQPDEGTIFSIKLPIKD